MHPPSIDHPLPQTTLEALAGQTITAEGLGGEQALTLFIETLAPACISQDHPRYLSFVPTAPSEVSTLFDLSSAPPTFAPAVGWKVPVQSMPKTRHCAGFRTLPDSPLKQAALSSVAVQRAISQRLSRPAMTGDTSTPSTRQNEG